MRVFIAVDLDQAARSSVHLVVERVRRRLADRGPRITWVGDGQLHVTLHFLGEIDEARVERLRTALEPPLNAPPFRLSFGPVGTFPERGQPRVIWMSVDTGHAELVSIHRELGRRLQAIGVEIDPRPFSPHVTIGRVRSPWRPGPRRLDIDGNDPPLASAVQHVTTYESRLTRDGPIYREIGRTLLSFS